MKVYVLMTRTLFGDTLVDVFETKEKAIKYVTDLGFTYSEVGDETYFIVEKKLR